MKKAKKACENGYSIKAISSLGERIFLWDRGTCFWLCKHDAEKARERLMKTIPWRMMEVVPVAIRERASKK